MLQANPNLTPNLIKAILQYTAQRYPGYSPLRQGAGFLNTLGAVRLAKFYLNPRAGRPDADAVGVEPSDSVGQPPPDGRRHHADRERVGGEHRLGHGQDAESGGDNVVWGTMLPATTSSGARRRQRRLGHARTATTWSGARPSSGDNVVWGTTSDGDNIVWGTDCGGADCDNVVWGTASDGDNIVWGTAADGDNVVWGTSMDAERHLGDVSGRGRDLGQQRRRPGSLPGKKRPSRCPASTSSSATQYRWCGRHRPGSSVRAFGHPGFDRRHLIMEKMPYPRWNCDGPPSTPA